MTNDLESGSLPLNHSFAFLGQRYIPDSHVFSNVVYDRVPGRMMQDPLDAAFAAIGNDQAGLLLDSELTRYQYAPQLASTRVLLDAHPPEFWASSLYNQWMNALRQLSPPADLIASELPSFAQTSDWGRRILNTQLASWAELRHDTLLYAKQSYTSGASCEFPDAYVEPYPSFFAGLADFAALGQDVVEAVGTDVGGATQYFGRLAEIMKLLEGMALRQQTGELFTTEQMAFINQAVSLDMGCGDPVAFGWYQELFYNDWSGASLKFDPTIADVHTQPTDEAGNLVGHVLHVATGRPRLMIVTAETCTGPRAYVGLASSYFEQVTKDFERKTDESWAEDLDAHTPIADVPWMRDLIVGSSGQ